MRSFLTRIFPELIRINISLSVTLSAFASWVLVSGSISGKSFLPLFGIFLLACGASVLNQVQEKKQDAIMNRTKSRPLPSGRLNSQQALLLAFILLLCGFAVLASGFFWYCILLGILNILWYNGLYTWLKKITAFAVVPGALSGVIPVFMGCSAAGGSLTTHPVLLLAFFLFMWQIPHFWLLMLKYQEEYRSAGFPVMTDILSPGQFRNIILAWVLCASLTSLLLVLAGLWIFFFSKAMIIGVNIFILALFFFHFCLEKDLRYRFLFITMNAFLLLVLSMLILEKIIL